MLKFASVLSICLFCLSCSDFQTADAKPEEENKAKPVKEKDYEAHIANLKKTIPDGFHIYLQKPFVVIGDESKETVALRSARTIKWAVDHLKKDYFPKDPDAIINIWLFKNAKSYEENTLKLFNERPISPYGYYSPSKKVLLMNIATGGGTLVHEIVHPFMESNFKDCPSWFNEGLASLYEACKERDGQITGLVNWRLKGLKKAINDKSLMTFKDLCATTTEEFYSKRSDKYAQARYLCYYLQEKGLLRKYYKTFTANVKQDPTGYDSLKKVLKVEDMKAFQEMWEKWCLEL